jgi:ribosomal protein S18 acetylase RimI-like enzyme
VQGQAASGTEAAMELRSASPDDVEAIEALDPRAHVDEERRRFIRHAVAEGSAFVAERRGAAGVVGYVVLEHTFFGHGFVSMLVVHPDHRRGGVGSALMRSAEGACRSARIFTSTNRSNRPMQALLEALGYVRSGIVDDLDPGDPELVYSRPLR